MLYTCSTDKFGIDCTSFTNIQYSELIDKYLCSIYGLILLISVSLNLL
jgi:hypothetical protein